MPGETTKISSNRQKKIDIVTELTEKFGKANAIVFTNYQGITHKQLEGFKRAVKPLKAEYVVAKNSLLTIALNENNIKLSEDRKLDGQTGTLFLYDDVISPLKALAKVIKELNLPSVKFGIMEKNFITGEQVLKLSTLPTKEVLLAQLVGGLKGPIFGLHRALNWNLQKLVMTLNAVMGVKPAAAAPAPVSAPASPAQTEPEPETILEETPEEKKAEEPASESAAASDVEPETIADESKTEKLEEQPGAQNQPQPETEPETILAETKTEKLEEQPSAEEVKEENKEEVKSEGGEN